MYTNGLRFIYIFITFTGAILLLPPPWCRPQDHPTNMCSSPSGLDSGKLCGKQIKKWLKRIEAKKSTRQEVMLAHMRSRYTVVYRKLRGKKITPAQQTYILDFLEFVVVELEPFNLLHIVEAAG